MSPTAGTRLPATALHEETTSVDGPSSQARVEPPVEPPIEPPREAPPAPPPERFASRTLGASGHESPATSGRTRSSPEARVDLDLKAADIHDVFRLLADVGRVNIVVAGEVSGTITMRLRQVPWDRAMEVIAHARGLSYEREGNVILVRAAGQERR